MLQATCEYLRNIFGAVDQELDTNIFFCISWIWKPVYLTLKFLLNANIEKRNRSISVVNIDQIPLQVKLSDILPVKLYFVRKIHANLESFYHLYVFQLVSSVEGRTF